MSENKSITIGLMGLIFNSSNLGCCALAYGFLKVIETIAERKKMKISIISFEDCDENEVSAFVESKLVIFEYVRVGSIREPINFINFYKNINRCAVIFDFTSGDSFTDIYGKDRYYSRTIRKDLVNHSKSKLVLGSQTIGPFENYNVKKNAKRIALRSYAVVSRDSISSKYVADEFGLDPIQTIDVAFMLPYKSGDKSEKTTVIGFNPSGLLWNGMNIDEFDYKLFCEKLIEKLLSFENTEVVLVAHVRDSDLSILDNDLIPCKELAQKYKISLSPEFRTPMEAKEYISKMDLFIGSRMHATIASISSGVPTIPIAYSRKFKGVFSDLDYEYIIETKNENAISAVDRVCKYYTNYDLLINQTRRAGLKITADLEKMIETYSEIIMSILGGKRNI